jgi:hypothetical protein
MMDNKIKTISIVIEPGGPFSMPSHIGGWNSDFVEITNRHPRALRVIIEDCHEEYLATVAKETEEEERAQLAALKEKYEDKK